MIGIWLWQELEWLGSCRRDRVMILVLGLPLLRLGEVGARGSSALMIRFDNRFATVCPSRGRYAPNK